jgi:hypothetical protein
LPFILGKSVDKRLLCWSPLAKDAPIRPRPASISRYRFFQNQQLELDLLVERANEITKQADERNRVKTQSQSGEVSEEWSALVGDLESRRDTLTKLAQIWETFEGRWQHFEGLLSSVEERAKHVDAVVRSKEHVIATNNDILVSGPPR